MTNRTECSPRKIKRIKKDKDNQNNKNNQDTDSKPNEDLAYNFYRFIIHPMILRLKSQKDKLNYSQWLMKLDTCDDPDYRLPLIKMLFISLKNNRTLKLYAEPPVDDLSELNLDTGDSTMDMLQKAQESTNEYYILQNEDLAQEIQHKRSAAVATDLCSYIATKTSQYLVQSFYVRSDFPIQTWHNPAAIVVPNTIDHNQWELYLSRFDLLMDDPAIFESEHANTCESIMNLDQVQKELNSSCIFRWHPNSILYSVDRPKRSAGFVNIDQDISTQSANQQQLDESAFTIVHNKSFPGYKMLNPKIYSTILMPDPDFVFKMTDVRIIHNSVSHISNAAKDKSTSLKSDDCQLKKQIMHSQTCLINSDKPKPICNKLTKICSTKSTQNKDNCQKPSISSECHRIHKATIENNCKSNEANNGCENKLLKNSKFTHKNLESEFNLKSEVIFGSNMSSKKQNSCFSNNQSENCMNNESKLRNAKKCNTSANSGKSSTNDDLNCNKTTSNYKMSSDQISKVNCSNTCKNTSNHFAKQHIENKYDLGSCMKYENQNAQYKSQNCKQRNDKKYEEQRTFNSTANNISHCVQSKKADCENENYNLSTRRNNSKRPQKSKLRSTSVPCNYDRTNEKNSKSKRKNQNDSYELNESINKYTLPAMNKCSDRNEKMSKSRYDENFNLELTNYSDFASKKCRDGSQSSPNVGKNRIMQRQSSLNNLPRNLNILSSDESCNSDSSTEIGVNGSSTHPIYSNSSESLMTINSDFSSIDTYPGHGFDYPSKSLKSRENLNSATKYANIGSQININYTVRDDFSESTPSSNYTNAGIRCLFNNSNTKQDNSNAKRFKDYKNNISMPNVNNDWEIISSGLIDNNIEDFPYTSYEKSCSNISLINTSHDLQDINMPNISYETTFSDNNLPTNN